MGHSSTRIECTAVSRHVPSGRRTSRRVTPSGTAPSLRMAARDRALMTSVWILTRPKPHVSKACPRSSSLLSGLTCGAPPPGADHRPPEVHVLAHGVDVAQAARPDDGARRAEGAVADETHGVCRPAGPARRDGVRDQRLRLGEGCVRASASRIPARSNAGRSRRRRVRGRRPAASCRVGPSAPREARRWAGYRRGRACDDSRLDGSRAASAAPAERWDVSEHLQCSTAPVDHDR